MGTVNHATTRTTSAAPPGGVGAQSGLDHIAHSDDDRG